MLERRTWISRGMVALALAICALLIFPGAYLSGEASGLQATAPTLGTAKSFAVLGGSDCHQHRPDHRQRRPGRQSGQRRYRLPARNRDRRHDPQGRRGRGAGPERRPPPRTTAWLARPSPPH